MTGRMVRLMIPALALAGLAAILVLLGLALTSPAHASSPKPVSTQTARSAAAPVSDAIAQFGQDVTIPAGELVQNVVVGGGDLTIDGGVQDSVVTFGGKVLIRGTVKGNLVAFGSDVRLGPEAVIGSRQSSSDSGVVLFGGTLTRAPGSRVNGSIQSFEGANWPGATGWMARHALLTPWWGFTLFGWVVQTAVFLVLALVVAALMPGQMRTIQRHLTQKPAASLGWGAFIVFLMVPAVLVVLVISIVGLLLVLPYFVVVPLMYFFVITTVAAYIGARVLAGTRHGDNLMLAVTLGVVGTTVISRIPVVGFVALLLMTVLGTGAATLAFSQWRRQARQATAAAEAGTGAPALDALAAPTPPETPVDEAPAGEAPAVQTKK